MIEFGTSLYLDNHAHTLTIKYNPLERFDCSDRLMRVAVSLERTTMFIEFVNRRIGHELLEQQVFDDRCIQGYKN